MDAFLSEVRKAIEQKNVLFDSKKPKNKQTLAALAIKPCHVYEEIARLTYEDYQSGPDKDNRPGHNEDVWVFKKFVFSQLMYIKLEFIQLPTSKKLLVMSFHIDNL